MTASLQRREDRPNYVIVLAYKDEKTGKHKTEWISSGVPTKGNNKRRAEERMREVLEERREQLQQNIDLTKDILFTEFIKEWLENHKHALDEVTYDSYRLIIYNQILPYYEPKRLKVKDVLPLHIQQYVTFKLKTASANTAMKHLWNLSKCLDSAVKQRLIPFNPVKMIEKPKKVKYTGAKYYNERQIDELVRIFKGDVLEGVILFAVFYGLRRSELIGLKWEAVDFDNRCFTVKNTVVQTSGKIYHKESTKTKSSYRTLPMPDIIIETLERIKAEQGCNKSLQPNDYVDEGYIFTKIDGTVIPPNYVTKHFKDVLAKNNMPIIRLHDLRHSAASYLFHLGFSMKEIQTWLGHGDIGTTMNLYTHLDLSAKRGIAENLNEQFLRFGT